MSQIERLARNGLTMERIGGENGELLSLQDHEEDIGGAGEAEVGGGGSSPGRGSGGGIGDEDGGYTRNAKRRSRSSGRSNNCCESLLKFLGLVPCPSLLSWIILLLGRSDNCCESLLKCLGLVPCPSLLSWIILLLGLGCLTGSLLIGTWRTRDLLKNDSDLLWFMEYTIIGVVIGMFVVGTLLLAAGHLSTEPTSRRLFNSFTKNRCAQGLNIFALVMTYILTLAWILITVLLATPLVLLINIYIVNPKEIHPQHYGFNSSIILNSKFKEDGDNLLITYGVAFFGSLLVVNSMICFIISITANITHLRDNRFATLNAYGSEEVRNSKHSVVDTNM